MPATADGLDRAVTGHVHAGAGCLLVLLDQRLQGHDSFLHATLIIEPDRVIPARVLTLDARTVLRLAEPEAVAAGLRPGQSVVGTLRLGRPARPRPIPADLAAVLDREQLNLDALPAVERRHLLGFLAEATTPAVRQARIQAILGALRTREPR